MNKKGFTLIELLAVIVILAIILLIVMPIVLNVINDARKGAFQASAYGLMKTAENKCLSDLVQNYDGTAEIIFDEGSIITGELDFSGKGPQTGRISVNSQCEIALAIHDGTWGCASAGTKLKHASYDGNNSSGFSAIRGGYRSSGEWFGWLEVLAWYWTATEFDATNATTRTLSNNPPDEIRRRSADNKAMGFTVRCFLDD